MKKQILKLAVSLALITTTSLAGATEPTATPKHPLTVDECIQLALRSAPELGEAQADIELTSSKLDEAKAYRYPQIEALALVGPAPTARKEDLFTTDRSFFRFNKLTWFASADATIIQPLYTFGKISENMKAARHGIEVDRSRKEQRVNEVALKVREYYYGLLLAREMKELVLEVQDNIAVARKKAQKLLDQGSNNVEELDLYKLDTFAGVIAKYLEEANKGEKLALAALRARLGLPIDAKIEIAEERLTIPNTPVPEYEVYLQRAIERRPEFKQIAEGLKARAALVEAAKANYYPDIFVGGLVSWAYADDRDRINNPYITDRFQHMNAGVALGARWKLDFGITSAKVSAERAQYIRLLSTKEFANQNIPLQVKKFYLEQKEAENSAIATKGAYTNSKKWAVTALANFDFGVGPAKEIFEALLLYSTTRADYFKSIYNYRIALANLDYATNESPMNIGSK